MEDASQAPSPKMTTEDAARIGIVVCRSRCLYCGRLTPHEACHAHAYALNPTFALGPGEDLETLWSSAVNAPAETCVDPDCPVWLPGESNFLRPWWPAWKQVENEVLRLVHEAWKQRMYSNGYARHPWQGYSEAETNSRPRCSFEDYMGPCRRPPEKHHVAMDDWEKLSPRERCMVSPPRLEEAFALGYAAAKKDP